MNLKEFFHNVVSELRRRDIQFALAGGMVASFYRKAPRATHDLDVLIWTKENPERKANELIKSFDLEAHPLRQADLEGGPMFAIKKKSTPVYIVAGRARSEGTGKIGLDFILPAIPWAAAAISRAQDNQIDFGFGAIPCLTVEDVLLAKFYALKNQSTRFMDLDDIKSIFESNAEMDLSYLSSRMQELSLSVPKSLEPFVPKAIRLVTRRSKR